VNKMTILLRPNGSQCYSSNLQTLRAIEPPIWLTLLANHYNSDCIIDAEAENLSTIETMDRVMALKPDKVIILATGSHPSAYIQQKEIATKLDILLTARNIKVETFSNLPVNPITLGRPKLELLDFSKYRAHNWHSWSNNCNREPYGVIYTSISCPFKCNFCAVKSFYGETYEERPIGDVNYDFATMYNYGIKNIKIMDELFIFKSKRVHDICDNIISNGYDFNIWAYARIDIMTPELLSKLKKAGVNWLAYGIESGNDEVRKHVLKGNFNKDRVRDVVKMTKDAGINVLGNYMFGFWEDTKETMQETLDFAIELNCEYANLYTVVAYPNTDFYNQMKANGVELPTRWEQYAQMSEKFLPLPTATVSAIDVLKFRDDAFNTYFKNESYLNMMKNKFDYLVMADIDNMCSVNIKRDYVKK